MSLLPHLQRQVCQTEDGDQSGLYEKAPAALFAGAL